VSLPLLLGGLGLGWAMGTQRDDDGFDLVTVRLSARSSDASTVFIGIALSADVARYLGRASYDEISDLRTGPFGDSLTRRGTGGDLNTVPTERGFWTAQGSGRRAQHR
jgi:hypothetical protein